MNDFYFLFCRCMCVHKAQTQKFRSKRQTQSLQEVTENSKRQYLRQNALAGVAITLAPLPKKEGYSSKRAGALLHSGIILCVYLVCICCVYTHNDSRIISRICGYSGAAATPHSTLILIPERN